MAINIRFYNFLNIKQLLKSYNLRKISFLSKNKEETDIKKESDEENDIPTLIQDDIDTESQELEIEKKRNVSRLLPQHRSMLYEHVPYKQSESWVHETVKYKRMMYGRYGEASNVNPAICFPISKELAERTEYERIAFPHSLKEMMEINKSEIHLKKEAVKLREEQIAKKLEKLDQWKHELHIKVAKKEADAKAAKDRKDRLFEEVRRYFGYNVDPRDERFKEMLEQKEKEDKKRLKEEKKKLKEAKIIAKITNKSEETV